MAIVLDNRVKQNSTTSGTGTLDLNATVPTGFISFASGIGNNNKTYYTIHEQGTNLFEVGIGTVTDAATDTLSRDTVLDNSSGNTSKINFSGGQLDVFCTLPSSKAVYLDENGDAVGAAGPGFAVAMAIAL